MDNPLKAPAMHQQIFVNLPTRDLPRAMAFWRALGYGFNLDYTDDKAACLVLGENLFAMLLVETFFQGFTAKPVADATRSTEVLIALSCDTREQLDTLVQRAVANGGRAPRPLVDHGFMVQHGFEDPDGHIWELMVMLPPGA